MESIYGYSKEDFENYYNVTHSKCYTEYGLKRTGCVGCPYGKDFELHKSIELLEKGYFGDVGDKKHLLGDYIAIGTYTHKQAILVPLMPKFKGHHTSLTEEMEVPLIILNN